MSCRDSEKVLKLLDGPCSPEAERWLETHFATCRECRRELDSSLEELRRSAGDFGDVTLPESLYRRLRASGSQEQDASAPGLVEDVPLGPPRTPKALGALGPYDVVSELGHGGFGVVFLAHDPQVNHEFAVKVMWPKLAANARYLAEFYEEARKSNEVKSPYLVSVIRVGRPPEFELPCLVMEYVEGESLRDVIRRETSQERRAGCRRWAAVIQRVAEGLHALHEKGILHRDVKAANILLDRQSGTPKLTDFGLASNAARPDAQAREELVGTLPYLAPETISSSGRDGRTLPDRRSDVYSLGLVLYECLTGERPFRADGAEAIVRQILDETPVPPRKRNDAVPRDLETITLKCLSKSPDERYSTAEALARDLGRFLANEPIQARPASPLRRARLWCRRHPTATVLAVLAVVVLLVLVTVPWVFLSQKQVMLQETQRERDRAIRSNQQRFESLEFIADQIVGEIPLTPENRPLRRKLEEAILGRFREAIAECGDVNDAYYGDACAMFAYYAQGFSRLEEAREYYGKAIAVYEVLEAKGDYSSEENHAKFCLNMANVCHGLGRKEEAFEYLTRALGLWKEIERRNPAAGPRREVGETLSQRGHLKALDRQWNAALEDYRLAENRFRQLLEKSPDDPQALTGFAGLKRNMGNAWDALAKASVSEEHARNVRKSYEEAIALCRAVTGSTAQDRRFRDELAEHYNALAVTAKQAGDQRAAHEAYEQSLAIRRALVKQYSGDIGCRVGLGRTLNNVAYYHYGLKDWPKARSVFREAIDERERLVELRPTDPDLRSSLGNTYLLASDVEIAQGDLKAARVLNGKSVDAATEAVRLAPSQPLFKGRLAKTLHDRGQLLEQCDDRQGALESYQRAIVVQGELLQMCQGDPRAKADLAALHHVLGQVFVEMKRPQEATDAFKTAAATWREVGGATECHRAAKCYARCVSLVPSGDAASRERLVEQALAALREAVRAGFTDVAALGEDDDFAGIREEKGFQQLLKSATGADGKVPTPPPGP